MAADARMADVAADDIYRVLVEAHRGLSDEDSAMLNTRLVLVLARSLPDLDALRGALTLAKAGLGDG